MANRTVKDAHTVKGTNPQYLIEKIIRARIYDSKFWKEECFALTGKITLTNINNVTKVLLRLLSIHCGLISEFLIHQLNIYLIRLKHLPLFVSTILRCYKNVFNLLDTTGNGIA